MEVKSPPLTSWERCYPQIPIETTVWYRSNAALRSCGNGLLPKRRLGHIGLVEVHQDQYTHHNQSRHNNQALVDTSPDAHHHLLKDEADWVFTLTALPPPGYTLKDIVKVAAPCVCSVIIAMLWIALRGGDTHTAVTFVTFIFMANVGRSVPAEMGSRGFSG
ncbi:uncharacterized protein H6S33_008249 [Morchella sextelata]|uniref:uncharacterized protein n=1 Tax=Morchella sextelata TaxID=1174677 RepID=UPI001D04BADB|nr:uncharacterized protein H6S33_008249 [Morchella sextelata]KAH0603245.1 hypothetical protein H6S33_008249 [Morchella sextelata]